METRKVPEFYDWSVSVTGGFGQEELTRLRDEHPTHIAQALWPGGRVVQQRAIGEFLAHGNPRKAAQVAQELVKVYPVCKKSLVKDLGKEVADLLLKTRGRDLLKLPSKPSEYRP